MAWQQIIRFPKIWMSEIPPAVPNNFWLPLFHQPERCSLSYFSQPRQYIGWRLPAGASKVCYDCYTITAPLFKLENFVALDALLIWRPSVLLASVTVKLLVRRRKKAWILNILEEQKIGCPTMLLFQSRDWSFSLFQVRGTRLRVIL